MGSSIWRIRHLYTVILFGLNSNEKHCGLRSGKKGNREPHLSQIRIQWEVGPVSPSHGVISISHFFAI